MRNWILVCTVLLGLLLVTSQASAVIVTDTAQFSALSLLPPLGPPLHFTSLESASNDQNRLFTNQLGGTAVGDEVRTVGAVLVTGVKYGTVAGPQNATGILADPLDQWVAVFGVKGTVTTVASPIGAATFTLGRLELVKVPIGTFNAQDPTTWGFLAVAPPGQYGLIGQDLVLPGAQPGNPLSTNPSAWPEQITLLPSFTDVGALNTQIGVASQGVFLFAEDPLHHILDSDSGQIIPPAFGPVVAEGLVVETAQTVVNVTGGYLTPAMKATLNGIGNWAFGGGATAFANFGSAGLDDFIVTISGGGPPNFVTNGPGGVDFTANLGASADPTLQTIPEPISVLVWGGLALILAWALRKRV